MKRLLFGCVLLMLPAGTARAELVCAETPFDAGTVAGGGVLAHRFLLVNRGGSVVEITEVKPGCGCMRPHLERPTLRPGEQAALTLEVNTLTQAPGPNLWRAVVYYRTNGQPAETVVQVRAHVVAVVSVQPASLLIHTHTAARGAFVLSEKTAAPLTIRAATASSAHVRVACGSAVREADGWKRTLALEVLPSLPEGRLEGVLKIHTDDPKYAELSVPFTVVKRSPDRVQASPASLSVSAGAAAPPSRIVLLEAGDSPVKVERVEPGQPFLVPWASGPGARATLRIAFDVEKLPADRTIDTQVRVHVSQPFPQVVDVPVHCVRP